MTPSPDPHAAGKPSGRPTDSRRPPVPRPLAIAIGLVVLESMVLVAEGLALVPAVRADRLTMGVTSVVFFLLYGALLGLCAWQLRRLRSWARAPVVLAQLIQILVGTGFWGGATTVVSIALIAVGVVVLGGVLHPASLAALDPDRRPPPGS